MPHPKILLLSYQFPPTSQIGARRWAKFARALADQGVEVFVIAGKTESDQAHADLWGAEVLQHPRIHITRIAFYYPQWFWQTPRSWWGRVRYRIWWLLLTCFSRGTIYDAAVLAGGSVDRAAGRLIKAHQIDRVIATGAPFRMLYYAARLKKRFAQLKVFADFRDPWTWGTHYGFGQLSPQRFQYEQKLEKYVLEKSDGVWVPYVKMQAHLQTHYPHQAHKVKRLSHGFDHQKISVAPLLVPRSQEKPPQVIYFGSLYDQLQPLLRKLFEPLRETAAAPVYFDFYALNARYQDVFEDEAFAPYVSLKPPVREAILLKQMATYDWTLLVFPPYAKNSFSSKFYEMVAARIPILYLGERGEVAHFIEKNQLGKCFAPDEADKVVPFLRTSKAKDFPLNRHFDLTPYTFAHLARQIMDWMSDDT